VYQPEFVDMLIEFFSQSPTREVKNRDSKGNETTQTLPGVFPTLARFAAEHRGDKTNPSRLGNSQDSRNWRTKASPIF